MIMGHFHTKAATANLFTLAMLIEAKDRYFLIMFTFVHFINLYNFNYTLFILFRQKLIKIINNI
jgi:hypothetical protein